MNIGRSNFVDRPTGECDGGITRGLGSWFSDDGGNILQTVFNKRCRNCWLCPKLTSNRDNNQVADISYWPVVGKILIKRASKKTSPLRESSESHVYSRMKEVWLWTIR